MLTASEINGKIRGIAASLRLRCWCSPDKDCAPARRLVRCNLGCRSASQHTQTSQHHAARVAPAPQHHLPLAVSPQLGLMRAGILPGAPAGGGAAGHRAARRGTVPYGTARHSTAWHCAAWHSTAWFLAAQHCTAQPGTALHLVAHYSATMLPPGGHSQAGVSPQNFGTEHRRFSCSPNSPQIPIPCGNKSQRRAPPQRHAAGCRAALGSHTGKILSPPPLPPSHRLRVIPRRGGVSTAPICCALSAHPCAGDFTTNHIV